MFFNHINRERTGRSEAAMQQVGGRDERKFRCGPKIYLLAKGDAIKLIQTSVKHLI